MLTRFDPFVTPARLKGYAALLLAAYGVALAAWAATSTGGIDASGTPLGADFVQFHAAARLALEGRAADVFSPAAMQAVTDAMFPGNGNVFLWNYPPTFLLLVAPLGLLSYPAAFAAFMASTGALYALAAKALIRHRLWLLFAGAFPAAFLTVLHGQNAFLAAAALGIGLARAPDRPVLAGIALGLASYKPHLGLIVPLALVAGGHWRALAAAALTTLLFAAASWLAFGFDAWVAFFANLPVMSGIMRDAPELWPKMASVFATARMLGAPAGLAYGLQLAASLTVAAATVHAWSRPGPHDLKVALAVAATIIATPYLMDYDLILLGIPIALMARHALAGGRPTHAALLALVALSPLLVGLVFSIRLPIVAPALWCLFATVWATLGRERSRGPNDSAPSPLPAGHRPAGGRGSPVESRPTASA